MKKLIYFKSSSEQALKNNNVDHCTRMCHASSVAALMETIGSGAVTAPVSEIQNADVAILSAQDQHRITL